MSSGIISTLITHPFEIIRTKIQIHLNFHKDKLNHKEDSIAKQFYKLYKEKKLFDGVAPRLKKNHWQIL
jgi:hypothetical protein